MRERRNASLTRNVRLNVKGLLSRRNQDVKSSYSARKQKDSVNESGLRLLRTLRKLHKSKQLRREEWS